MSLESVVEPVTVTEVYIPRKVWTREDAHQLADACFPNADRLELVKGEIINRMGKKPPHVLWHNLIQQWLQKLFGADYVRSEAPIDVAPEDNPTSEPEPDLIVTKKSIREDASNPSPEDLRLVVEIADTTVSYDLKVKAKLYARAGIHEYWVVNIPEKKLVVHQTPENGSYTQITTHDSGEEIAPLAAAEARFCLDRL